MLSVFDGSVHGFVRIEGEDRASLERLVRYCARGPPAFDLAAPELIPAYEFDQSAPHDRDP